MRFLGCLSLVLVMVLAALSPTSQAAATARATEVPAFGTGPAYETLGQLAVLHEGRSKPFDTMARELAKQIYGSETITLYNAVGKPVATWGHNGAVLDMSVRPEFWDDQDLIRVDYIPLKQMILAEPIRSKLNQIAANPATPADDKAEIETLAKQSTFSSEQLTALLATTRLAEKDVAAIRAFATKLQAGREHRWLSPRELENAKVLIEGRVVPFDVWLADIAQRSGGGPMSGARNRLSELEKNAQQAAIALRHYQAIRGDHVSFIDPLDLVMPRPSNQAYLSYSGAVRDKIVNSAHEGSASASLTPMEQDAASALAKYLRDVPRKDWSTPGKGGDFDKRFAAWLNQSSSWVSARVLMDSKPEDLAAAGYPADKATAFRAAYKALQDAEIATPGQISPSTSSALVTSARGLAESVGTYPSQAALAREYHFNAFAPFYRAAWGYGLAFVFLLICLGIPAEVGSTGQAIRKGFRGVGLVALLAAIALEIYGFYCRVRISGWSPVTNMYETVIWVALMASVLGVVLELIYRKTYTVVAAAGVSFLLTVLAYKVPLLDPQIKNLEPVLRSNYWLAIHVLTIVSSYAAFALVMGLGLIATWFYLTATYRRSVGYRELALPLLPGLPTLGLGLYGLSKWGSGGDAMYYLAAGATELGGVLTIMGLGALLGEGISRWFFQEDVSLDAAAVANGQEHTTAPAATAVQTVTVGEAGAIATLSRPTVAEIRARALAASGVPKLTARQRAEQRTAAVIKPLSNFIYRAMQVGVLLVAAGTILGGLWADVSWGRFWGWDPKEVWALITLLTYLIPLHGRFAGWINTFGLVVSSVVCFLSVVMAWYGVNFVLGVGLHSYGFTDGGGQFSVMTACLAALAFVGAAAYRRSLAKREPMLSV